MKWPTAPIGELVTVRGGGTPKRDREEYFRGTIPWVTPKDMKSWEISDSQLRITEAAIQNSAAKLVPSNTVLLVVRSGVLKHTAPIALNRCPVAINQDMKSLECGPSLAPEFLARFLKQSESIILSWVRATTADNYPIEKIRELEIPLPPLAEQRRMVALLDQADELRQKRLQALGQLDALGPAIFNDRFGDLRSNSKGWSTRVISEVCSLVVDCVNRTAPIIDYPTHYKMIRTTNIRNGRVHLDDVKYVTEAVFREWNRRATPQIDDVLLTREAPVGQAGIVETTDNFFLGQRIMLYRPDPTQIEARFLLFCFMDGFLQDQFARHGSGSTVKHLPLPACRAFHVRVPPLSEQQAFATAITRVERLKVQHRAHLAELDALFASLQHRAFNGELTSCASAEQLKELKLAG